jgi:hypothetical protein
MGSQRDLVGTYLINEVNAQAAADFQAFSGFDKQRVGQAFMNALRKNAPAKYDLLTGANSDPFYIDTRIPAAIDFLRSQR